jgi:hypothetical protein
MAEVAPLKRLEEDTLYLVPTMVPHTFVELAVHCKHPTNLLFPSGIVQVVVAGIE